MSKYIDKNRDRISERLKLPWLKKIAEWDNYAKYDPSKKKRIGHRSVII